MHSRAASQDWVPVDFATADPKTKLASCLFGRRLARRQMHQPPPQWKSLAPLPNPNRTQVMPLAKLSER